MQNFFKTQLSVYDSIISKPHTGNPNGLLFLLLIEGRQQWLPI